MRNGQSIEKGVVARKVSLTRLFVVAMIGLPVVVGAGVGGSALAASPFAIPTPAAAMPTTKSIVRAATLSTADQNMWGGAATAPTNLELVLFEETWSESGGFGEIEEVCALEICTYYGAGLDAAVSGEISLSVGLQGLEGGTLSVTYPVTVTFTAPADNSFDPGAEVDIKTSMVVDSANAKIVASIPPLDHVGLNGTFEFDASLTGQLCFIACTEKGNIFPPIEIDATGDAK